MSRTRDLNEFYRILKKLENILGGKRKLDNCNGKMDWPKRGVYFFFEADEERKSGDMLRLTRIGTHAISKGSKTTLWDRLRTHRGALSGKYAGGGNHRGSVFRKEVGQAIIERDNIARMYPKWGKGSSADSNIRKEELEMERKVSSYIRRLPFLWLKINDKPSKNSKRANIEKNSIALVSNFNKESIDERNKNWLGKHSPKNKIKKSGLWNVDHVDEEYNPKFLDMMEGFVENL